DARIGDRVGRLLDLAKDGLVVANDLDQVAPIVGVHRARLHYDAVDHARLRARRFGARGASSGRRVVGPSMRLAPVSATRLPARWSDAMVPASVHQPSRISHESWPRLKYHVLTSVISSSPRPEGFSVRQASKTWLS